MLEELGERPFIYQRFTKQAYSGTRDRITVTEALKKAGATPEGLRWFIPSHGHEEHLGGMVEL
jgi:beta-lactamase superfamily II metal-dependent hydrolase